MILVWVGSALLAAAVMCLLVGVGSNAPVEPFNTLVSPLLYGSLGVYLLAALLRFFGRRGRVPGKRLFGKRERRML